GPRAGRSDVPLHGHPVARAAKMAGSSSARPTGWHATALDNHLRAQSGCPSEISPVPSSSAIPPDVLPAALDRPWRKCRSSDLLLALIRLAHAPSRALPTPVR